jgi:hypothetical protein
MAAVVGVILLAIEPKVLLVGTKQDLPVAEALEVEPEVARGEVEEGAVDMVIATSSLR